MDKRQKILIVDDSEFNRDMLKEILGETYNYLEAENGNQAIQMIGENIGIDLMLLDINMPQMNGFEVLEIMKKNGIESSIPYDLELERYARYAEQQERLISPEGTFPIVGRSLAYRFGAFHALSDVAYRKLLPERVKPAQVRSALSAIINRQVNAPGTFNPEGWLRVGFAGYQPHIGETYISTGSLYLCAAVFIALGLPESDEFWSSPSADWTCKKGWAGIDLDVDKALKK